VQEESDEIAPTITARLTYPHEPVNTIINSLYLICGHIVPRRCHF
jgi:hypothetical protein